MTETKPSLTEFLLARLSEDYADAMSGWRWKALPVGEYERLQARVLADVEAKRRIVERHAEHLGTVPTPHVVHQVDFRDGCDTLRTLALPYASHPDYREAWKP